MSIIFNPNGRKYIDPVRLNPNKPQENNKSLPYYGPLETSKKFDDYLKTLQEMEKPMSPKKLTKKL